MVGGGRWVATNFSVSFRQGFKLWGLSPWLPPLADPCLTLAWASQFLKLTGFQVKRKTDLPNSANSTILRINGETFTVKEINEHMGNSCMCPCVLLWFSFHSFIFIYKVCEWSWRKLTSGIFQNTACTRWWHLLVATLDSSLDCHLEMFVFL